MDTFERTPSEGGESQTRCNSSSPGFGRRNKSCSQSSRNKASHRNIPGINRGDQAAGTTQTSPISKATKNLVPKPNLNRPGECARALAMAGMNVDAEFTSDPRPPTEFQRLPNPPSDLRDRLPVSALGGAEGRRARQP